ncbi:MAG TPA: MFS transporter, partial [Bacteroidia bacterium]|nr:MFS transporter [Bacteroidia bacterium]
FSGKLTYTVGRVPVMLFGSVMTALCGLLYPWFATVWLFLLLRFLHGFSTGFAPTGAMAYVGDISPAHRRGEAIGLVSMFGTLGMAIGPALGSWVAKHTSLDTMFYLSSGCGFIAVAMTMPLRETLPAPQKLKPSFFKIGRNEFYEPRVLRPATVLFLACFSFGAMLTLVPDFSEYLGFENKGLFFTVFTLASLGVRFFSGKMSDRIGRVKTLKIGLFLLTVSMVMIGLSESQLVFLISAALFGIANGTNSPTIMAWTIDLSNDATRGRALSTAYIFLEAGIGGGALLGGWLYGNNAANFSVAFISCAALCFISFLILFFPMKHKVEKPATDAITATRD